MSVAPDGTRRALYDALLAGLRADGDLTAVDIARAWPPVEE